MSDSRNFESRTGVIYVYLKMPLAGIFQPNCQGFKATALALPYIGKDNKRGIHGLMNDLMTPLHMFYAVLWPVLNAISIP